MILNFVFQSENVETIEGILINDTINMVLPRNWERKKNTFLKLLEHEFVHLAISKLEGKSISKTFDFIYRNIEYFNIIKT